MQMWFHAEKATPDEIQSKPYVVEYQIEPPFTTALTFCPEADIATEDHALLVTPEDVQRSP